MKTIRISLAALAATAALGAVPALAVEDERNARAEGAPGYLCKQRPEAESKQPGYRNCVRLAAKARRQARNGDHEGGNPNERARTVPGRYCQAHKAHPGSQAFSDCVRTAAKARRAARS